jgi:hypothetical protein
MIKSFVSSLDTSLCIGLSKNGIALLRVSGWRQRQCQLLSDVALSEAAMAPTQIAAELGKLIKETSCDGLPATVIVADEWVRVFVVTPPKNCSRIKDCHAAANMRFQTLYGEAASGWHIEADWDPQHPFLACALHQSLRSGLQQLAADHRLTLTSVLPHFIAVWNRWHRQLTLSNWFGMVHDNHLTLGIVDQQRLCGVRTTSLPEHAWIDQKWLPDYVLREALRLNVPATTSLQLCGEIPGQWTTHTFGPLHCTRLDGIHQTSSRAGLSASLILAGSGLPQ